MPAKTARNVYDPRVRELIRATGKPDLFPELDIPRSTISGWLRGDFKPAVGAEAVSQTEIELHARLAKLERRIQILVAVLRLLQGTGKKRRPPTVPPLPMTLTSAQP